MVPEKTKKIMKPNRISEKNFVPVEIIFY